MQQVLELFASLFCTFVAKMFERYHFEVSCFSFITISYGGYLLVILHYQQIFISVSTEMSSFLTPVWKINWLVFLHTHATPRVRNFRQFIQVSTHLQSPGGELNVFTERQLAYRQFSLLTIQTTRVSNPHHSLNLRNSVSIQIGKLSSPLVFL